MAKGKKTQVSSKRVRKYENSKLSTPLTPPQTRKSTTARNPAETTRRISEPPGGARKAEAFDGRTPARRRQWDPPKKTKSVAPHIDAPSAFASPEQRPEVADSPRPSVCGAPSITPAEQVAIHMLLELADTVPKTPSPPSEEIAAQDAIVPSRNTPSQYSSLEAVDQAPIRRRPVDAIFITDKLDRRADLVFIEKLPPNASPASELQKKVQRDLGVLGPLTWVQQAQIHVATLGKLPGSSANVEDLPSTVVGRGPSFKSQSIREWREGVHNETTELEMEWDAEAQRGFVEAGLRWRARR
ncbi:hypothetical protein B0H16DRAFT_1451465 [Mycena metata]|uniref:Uncharacterized protein n=1 Tax=Mycena metata TaxID=1033252 RepID=A0AAD7JX61_9AGAR|nr:hypothetical protein B0H16DRAFT_1451465 [Mycena metata]